MPMFRRNHAAAETAPELPLAFAITVEDLQALERVTVHAREQLLKMSGSDLETIDKGSGYRLMLRLSERAEAARALGRSGIPMLVDEVGTVEAAVLNLESYQGDPVAVLEGYELLNRVTLLAELPGAAEEIDGPDRARTRPWAKSYRTGRPMQTKGLAADTGRQVRPFWQLALLKHRWKDTSRANCPYLPFESERNRRAVPAAVPRFHRTVPLGHALRHRSRHLG